jgi:hypothetical protein
MIIVDVIQSSESVAVEISKYLIEKKYALHTHIDTNRILGDNAEMVTVRLFFITKALLFDIIYNDIHENFGSEDLLIYASPVSHISRDFGEKLRLNLKAV